MPPEFPDLGHFFPVSSQTSQTDKLVLLRMRDLIRKRGNYKYLEIGSYLGGSLTPFLMDPACQLVLSIDDRGRVLPDERAINYDYTAVTTQSMLDNLHRSGLKTDKLKTFDGSVNRLDGNYDSSFDLAFIDGEHTDEACFRDFLWTMPLMKSNAVIAFHDSSLIYKALKLIQLFLDKTKSGSSFFKCADSEMSAFLFGDCQIEGRRYLGAEEDSSIFFQRAETTRIKQQFRNRFRLRFAPSKMLKMQVPLSFEIKNIETIVDM